jgi:uncharacterized protein
VLLLLPGGFSATPNPSLALGLKAQRPLIGEFDRTFSRGFAEVDKTVNVDASKDNGPLGEMRKRLFLDRGAASRSGFSPVFPECLHPLLRWRVAELHQDVPKFINIQTFRSNRGTHAARHPSLWIQQEHPAPVRRPLVNVTTVGVKWTPDRDSNVNSSTYTASNGGVVLVKNKRSDKLNSEEIGDTQPELISVRGEVRSDASTVALPTTGTLQGASGLTAEQEFFIPVHGQVRLTESEVEIVNHPAFQRMADVYQLGQVHFVFRGATHRRFEHALGTLHVAQMMIEQIEANRRNLRAPAESRWQYDKALTVVETSMIRLAALLHDLGHLPAGHTLEDELGLLPKHDEMRRLELVLDRANWHGRHTTTLRQLIDSSYRGKLEAEAIGVAPTAVVLAIVAKDAPVPLAKTAGLRISVCRDVVGNTICADLIDYLHRDWHHLGKPRYFDRRLIEYMELRLDTDKNGEQPASRIVVNLRSSQQVRSDAVTAILDLLESRYQLGEVALYHRTKLCAAAMLERAVAELADFHKAGREKWLDELVEALLEVNDEQMLDHLARVADDAASAARPSQRVSLKAAADIARALRVRHLFKQLYVSPAYHLANYAKSVQRLYGQGGVGNRLAALKSLEQDFELPAGSLAMYCPPSAMNTKIADVQILVDDAVSTLDQHEKQEGDAGLTGGHLGAQKKRFERLWRVLVAVSPEAEAQIREKRLFPVLIRAIESLVMGRCPPGVTLQEQSESIANEVGALLNRKIVPGGLAARASNFIEPYPTGAPALRNFFAAGQTTGKPGAADG